MIRVYSNGWVSVTSGLACYSSLLCNSAAFNYLVCLSPTVTSQVIDWLRFLPIRYVTGGRSDHLLLSRAEFALPNLLGSIGCSTLLFISAVHPVIDELELIDQFEKKTLNHLAFHFHVCLLECYLAAAT